MKFSNMKNAVKAYFERNWNKEDMMDPDEIPPTAHKSLKKILVGQSTYRFPFLSLFFKCSLAFDDNTEVCALLSSTVGSSFHYIWDVGGLFTVLIASGTIIFLFTTPPSERVRDHFRDLSLNW
ncbi:hypothetical protein H5410_012294 [Solanum commersonii]|uniref:Uncharacterized protein n=1 Tax=Solanum commersonii TaxID=4109 RepID=A0A9J6ART1_SOLCO|nr:hypothetical protein H5410_012294 [Solanum commersonii]